ncbi:MAG TPA: gamma-glutamyltransferase, partial [Erysipelotrichaceae bacterium]|nr:gamma-glutamyltransferase [Erysipelotrichaceae bacterium]
GPNKRTYHTIIPGFITKDGKAFAAFGVMGGYMQPQGHVQVVTNMIDRHMDIQSALDAPRWMWDRNNVVHVEPGMGEETVAWLRAKGHTVVIENEYSLFGRGQIIVRMENGVYCGACEPRTDSNIACC